MEPLEGDQGFPVRLAHPMYAKEGDCSHSHLCVTLILGCGCSLENEFTEWIQLENF